MRQHRGFGDGVNSHNLNAGLSGDSSERIPTYASETVDADAGYHAEILLRKPDCDYEVLFIV